MSKSDLIQIRYHAVTLIDLLAQSEKLAGWSKIPLGGNPSADFIAALKQTAGSVENIKKLFTDFFAQFENRRPLPQSLTADQKHLHERFRKCDLYSQQFSDTFVFYSPLLNDYGDTNVEPFYRMLSACSMAMVIALAAHVPMRGAVCIGVGLELSPNNFYGPALAQANYIENKVAEYPRIVVSQEACDFLKSRKGFSSHTLVEKLNCDFAVASQSLICADTDGNKMLDFMGQGIQTILGEIDPDFLRTIESAYRFVFAERARFQREGNEKLTRRYDSLCKYMEARLAIWGLDHLRGGGA